MKLLCLSNGHGEDVVAVEIAKQLQHKNEFQLAALPLVGEGRAYKTLELPTIGPVQQMPSGGFIYMDGGRQLWRDLQGGLFGLTLAQLKAVWQWGQNGGAILAVGDIVPLLFARFSGADYAFVGTAKSEYYLRDESGWLPQTAAIERWLGSVYHPWEHWLMRDRHCRAVFPRDSLTAKILQQQGIPAFDLGNPMMDGVVAAVAETDATCVGGTGGGDKPLTVLLLPGSRAPEALSNWQLILEAVAGILAEFSIPLLFLAAIAPALDLESFQECLPAFGWQPQMSASIAVPVEDSLARGFTQKNGAMLLTQNAYPECWRISELAIAMAGTATEQFVGLGKAAITIPGSGPQFTPAFAEAQSRLLGPSLILVEDPAQVAEAIQLVRNSGRSQLIAENGRRRMGTSGAAARIARCLEKKLLK